MGTGSVESAATWKPRLVALTACLLVAGFAGLQLSSWPVRLRYPGEDCMVEGILLAEALHLRQGVPIYSSFAPDRFDSANYGPLYYLLGARLVDPNAPAYFPLRLLSILGTLGCAVAGGVLSFRLTRSVLACLLARFLFLAYAIVTYYGCSVRSDTLGLFFSFVGVLAAFQWRERPAILLAGPLMLLGFFYKQQFVAAPFAVLIYLFLGKRYRLAAAFAAVMTLGGLGMLAFFHFGAFPGQAFVEHFFSYNLLPFSWGRLASGLPIYGIMFFVPVLVGLEFLRQCPHLLLKCYVGCVVLFSLLPLGRQGSDTNYFLESALLLSCLMGALVAKSIAERSRSRELLVLLGTTLFLGQLFAPGAPSAEDFGHDRNLQDFLHRNFSPRAPALGYYAGDLVRAGLETPISNLFHYTWLIRKGTISEESLLSQIRRQSYDLIVANHDLQLPKSPAELDAFLTEPLRKAILSDYRLLASPEMPGPEKFHPEDRFYIWVPRSRTVTRAP